MSKKKTQKIDVARLQHLTEVRGEAYGPALPQLRNVGQMMHAIICEYYQIKLPPLPADITSLMIATLKIARASRPVPYHKDNYEDAINYLSFANDFHPDNQNDAEDDLDILEAGRVC